jgi:hypothetical protein
MIRMTLRDYAAVGRGHHPDSVVGMRLSGFSSHLKDYNTGKHNWYKASEEGEKEKRIS